MHRFFTNLLTDHKIAAKPTTVGLAMFASSAVLAEPPATIRVPGIIRDFSKTDTNFAVVPSGGTGHYAGNLNFTTDASNRPAFSGDGAKVNTQWRDIDSKNIAPNMYMYDFGGTGVIPVVQASSPATGGQSLFDTYDSAIGPYGGTNVGPAPVYQVGATMPTITVPQTVIDLPSVGNKAFSGSSTLNADLHCNTLNITDTLTIHGTRNILCDGSLLLETQASILLAPGATLNLYMMQGGASWNHVLVGDSGNPHRVRVFNLSANELMIHNHAQVYAVIVMPNAKLNINNHGELFGRYSGLGTIFGNHAKIHIDGASPALVCGIVMKDTAGAFGAVSTGGIPSASAFDTWFTDTLGVNLSKVHAITLTRDSNGVYEYLDDMFYPIDNILLGNQADVHNHYFTYEIEVEFKHHACTQGFFEFEGDDDAWLFVNGQLAMDLGGMIPGVKQHVPIDRIPGLQDGETYRLQFFHARRQSNQATFRLRTNLDLIDSPDMTISPVGD